MSKYIVAVLGCTVAAGLCAAPAVAQQTAPQPLPPVEVQQKKPKPTKAVKKPAQNVAPAEAAEPAHRDADRSLAAAPASSTTIASEAIADKKPVTNDTAQLLSGTPGRQLSPEWRRLQLARHPRHGGRARQNRGRWHAPLGGMPQPHEPGAIVHRPRSGWPGEGVRGHHSGERGRRQHWRHSPGGQRRAPFRVRRWHDRLRFALAFRAQQRQRHLRERLGFSGHEQCQHYLYRFLGQVRRLQGWQRRNHRVVALRVSKP